MNGVLGGGSRMQKRGLCWVQLALAVLAALNATSAASVGSTSEFWAIASKRLLDWSYAGYAAGEDSIPSPDPAKPTANVLDHGAIPNDGRDDTAAFLAAIASLEEGVVFVPCGEYHIRGMLNMTRSITLRGACSACTTLVFPQSLQQLSGAKDTSQPIPSLVDSFINIRGGGPGAPPASRNPTLAYVDADSLRGTTQLQVKSTDGIVPGLWVTVAQSDVNGQLMRDMNLNLARGCGETWCVNATNAFKFTTRVAAVLGPHTVVLERPLPYNVSVAAKPKLYRWQPALSDVGVEGLTLVMKSQRYQGHFKEHGWNAIYVKNAANVWIRDVKIVNADLGISLVGCSFCTVTNITVAGDTWRAARDGTHGHHAVWVKSCQDVLVSNFDIAAPYVHDLSVEAFATGTVYSNGRGTDMSLDHHAAQSYGTLWTQLDLGYGTRAWVHGGNELRAPYTGPFTTCWNLVASKARGGVIPAPPSDLGPALNLIGVGMAMRVPGPARRYTPSWWVDDITPAQVQPQNLYQAQLAERMARVNTSTPLPDGGGRFRFSCLYTGDGAVPPPVVESPRLGCSPPDMPIASPACAMHPLDMPKRSPKPPASSPSPSCGSKQMHAGDHAEHTADVGGSDGDAASDAHLGDSPKDANGQAARAAAEQVGADLLQSALDLLGAT